MAHRVRKLTFSTVSENLDISDLVSMLVMKFYLAVKLSIFIFTTYSIRKLAFEVINHCYVHETVINELCVIIVFILASIHKQLRTLHSTFLGQIPGHDRQVKSRDFLGVLTNLPYVLELTVNILKFRLNK